MPLLVGGNLKEQVQRILEDPNLTFENRVGEFEKLLMVEALNRTNWIKLKAARSLRVTYRIFNYKYDKYGLGNQNPRKKRKTVSKVAS
jgi:transcriptional regulator with GAF, ATPase, and Fis domain